MDIGKGTGNGTAWTWALARYGHGHGEGCGHGVAHACIVVRAWLRGASTVHHRACSRVRRRPAHASWHREVHVHLHIRLVLLLVPSILVCVCVRRRLHRRLRLFTFVLVYVSSLSSWPSHFRRRQIFRGLRRLIFVFAFVPLSFLHFVVGFALP